jgi:hypothetical protein
LTELVNQLAGEIRALKADVRKLQLQDHRRMISLLETELDKTAAERQRLEMRESSLYENLAWLDQYLSSRDLADADRAEIELKKAAIGSTEIPRVRSERDKVSYREAEVRQRLTSEQQRWNQIAASDR